MKQVYEGKAKILYETEDPGFLIMHFKDDATAFNGKKFAIIKNKGRLNKEITTITFGWLEKAGIDTHFVRDISQNEILVRKVKIIPLEVVVRNVVAGSLSKRMGLKKGEKLKFPIVEFYYKSDELDDPMLNEYHIRVFDIADKETIEKMKKIAFCVNDLLKKKFEQAGILLVDFKIEFGKDENGKLILADEVTPDGTRLWDMKTGEVLDKDRFRFDLGDLIEGYEKILERIRCVS
ncbi:MAG: phosphoribosylaminoimidazolesuccinocarboxamide synthase [Candidatus Cloacimonas sp. 4484_209]|nr:MAG: phosphoribosylaminoimidazolesuccinocarboxamide synthase [Candidatus Cloacimonas sp. 4484_209]